MANDKFSIKEALNYGWDTFKSHVGFFIGISVAFTLLAAIPALVVNRIFPPQSLGLAFGRLVVQLINLVFGMYTTRIALNIHDRDDLSIPGMGDILSLFFPFLGGRVLYFLILLGGTILLIVPAMIWAYMFMYVGYIVIDKGVGPIVALKESKTITSGYKWDLFLFSMVLLVLNIAGMICLMIGLLVTIPITLMAGAYVYRRLNPAQTA